MYFDQRLNVFQVGATCAAMPIQKCRIDARSVLMIANKRNGIDKVTDFKQKEEEEEENAASAILYAHTLVVVVGNKQKKTKKQNNK